MERATSLDDLELRPKMHRVLSEHQVTLSQLIEMTAEDLMCFDGIGQGGVNYLNGRLRGFGLCLRPSAPKKSERRLAAEQRGAAFAKRWFAGETLDEIAKSSGISQGRVRQLIWVSDPRASEKKRAMRSAARNEKQARRG